MMQAEQLKAKKTEAWSSGGVCLSTDVAIFFKKTEYLLSKRPVICDTVTESELNCVN